jgi:multidrug transporter EmrE-like cation transporter
MGDRFFPKLVLGCAPLLLWALHFSVCYGVVAAQCSPAFIDPAMPALWLPWLVTVLGMLACGVLLWRACRVLDPEAGLAQWACAGSAVLALAGMAWTAVPMLLLGGCG